MSEMVIAIIAGRGGTGKTSQLISMCSVYSHYAWGMMELKDKRSLEHKNITFRNLTKLDKKYLDNAKAILDSCAEWVKDVLQDISLELVVLDGVSDLRTKAIDEWEEEKGRKLTGKNIDGWRAVNERVRKIVEPLMNWGIFNCVHVFMTAEMREIYKEDKNGVSVGTGKYEPAIKEWLEYPCEAVIILEKEKGKDHYWCSCEKAPLWSDGCFQEDLYKNTGLLEVLSMHGLLEMEEKE